MRKATTAKREPTAEPSPLELIEIAKGLPLNQNELALAFQSLAQSRLTQTTAKDYERIADRLREQLTVAWFYWQIAHEVCGDPGELSL
jgi:hypothetical protein